MATTEEEAADEDEPEVSTTTTEAEVEAEGEAKAEAEAEEAEETTRPIEHLQRLRLRCVYGIRVLTMTTAAASE